MEGSFSDVNPTKSHFNPIMLVEKEFLCGVSV